jgi:hypothetical protein
MIKRLDDLAEKTDKETMIVLDNAPWHKSKKFFGKLSQWQQQGLYIFHLPAYSPHMNGTGHPANRNTVEKNQIRMAQAKRLQFKNSSEKETQGNIYRLCRSVRKRAIQCQLLF